MSREGGTASAPQQSELLVEQCCRALNAMRPDAGGSELERERDAIQSLADLGHDRCISIRELELMAAMGDLFDEQLHRRKTQGLCRCQRLCIRRAFKGRQMMHLLALGPQCLSARDQNVNL
jgi:hypothetical protein